MGLSIITRKFQSSRYTYKYVILWPRSYEYLNSQECFLCHFNCSEHFSKFIQLLSPWVGGWKCLNVAKFNFWGVNILIYLYLFIYTSRNIKIFSNGPWAFYMGRNTLPSSSFISPLQEWTVMALSKYTLWGSRIMRNVSRVRTFPPPGCDFVLYYLICFVGYHCSQKGLIKHFNVFSTHFRVVCLSWIWTTRIIVSVILRYTILLLHFQRPTEFKVTSIFSCFWGRSHCLYLVPRYTYILLRYSDEHLCYWIPYLNNYFRKIHSTFEMVLLREPLDQKKARAWPWSRPSMVSIIQHISLL